MSTPEQQALTAQTAAIKAVDAPAPQQVASATLLTKVEALIAKLDASAKAEEAKAAGAVKAFFGKHWPWMVGAIAAASRFIHL